MIEAGRMELCLETFEIAPMLEDVVAIIQPLVEKNANTLIVNCLKDIGRIDGDVTTTKQKRS